MEPMKECRKILARSGSTFGLAFRVLPVHPRDAMTAFYAFCREVDDAVDGCADVGLARAAIAGWRGRVASVFESRPIDPVSIALHEAVRRFGIRREHLDLVIDGVEADLELARYETFADLYGYCYRVASAVGLVCVTVLGDTSREAFHYAELTGIAVQLTNILRDVGEDATNGRIYLPREDLRAFGVSEADVLARRGSDAFDRLLHFQARRAREFFDQAAAALPPRARHRLFFAEALRETYLALLDRIEAEGIPVLKRRVSIGAARKIAIALRRRVHPATWLASARAGEPS